jgi:predicted metal-dependent peptidase
MRQKSLISFYTNKDRNEFVIGLKEGKNFRAMTKEGESYTRFVDVFHNVIDDKNDKNEIDWKSELKRWINAAKKNAALFAEVDLSNCSCNCNVTKE